MFLFSCEWWRCIVLIFFQCVCSCSETIPRIGGQVSQGWHQTHPCITPRSFCPPTPIAPLCHVLYMQRFPSPSLHGHEQTHLQTICRKRSTVSPWPQRILSSFSPLFCLFSNYPSLSPCNRVNNPMSVRLIQSGCVWVRDKDYLSHKVTPSIPPRRAEIAIAPCP